MNVDLKTISWSDESLLIEKLFGASLLLKSFRRIDEMFECIHSYWQGLAQCELQRVHDLCGGGV